MSTGRDLISRVRSLNKLTSSDSSLTDRAIFKELKAKASLLIKREANLRRLWQSPNIFTTLQCIEMEQVPLGECCDYKSPCLISKSVKEIPQISEGIFGLLIQSVYNVDGSVQYKYSTPIRYSNILKLSLKDRLGYYWIVNKHLYISNPDIERINLSAYFDDDNFNPDDFNSCKDKNTPSTMDCINPLDKPFKIPSYLEDNLVTMVHDVISKTYKRTDEDVTPNNKDDQTPNRK